MKKRLSGSATIEAALIFPMIMAVIVCILYFALYYHDRLVLYGIALSEAQKLIREKEEPVDADGHLNAELLYGSENGSEDSSGRTEDTDAVRENFETRAGKRLLAAEFKDVTIEIEEKEVRISYTAEVSLPSGELFADFISGLTEITGEAHLSTTRDPEEVVRLMHGLVWRK